MRVGILDAEELGLLLVDTMDDVLLVLELVDISEEEVLLGTVVPRFEQTVPRADASLKVSAKVPLTTPYFVPDVVPTETLPLYKL